jgi:lipopolysaccharide/colanic/teichoic acid biosynthesis glycosyltransferase
VGAILGIVISAPLFAGIALAVKFTSPGPIFFIQERAGRGGKPFPMFKFRSMRIGAEAERDALAAANERDGPAFKIQNDPRVTALGAVLRRTNLDELPQLFNVLRGDMSFIGPRPLPCKESEACADWQLERLDVTPGLICTWQLSSKRWLVPFVQWMRMDIRYVRAKSVFMADLKLAATGIARLLAFPFRRRRGGPTDGPGPLGDA